MAKKSEKNSLVEICPIRNVVARFGNKWALLIIMLLHENGSTRFNRLGKMIPDISTKVLSGTLVGYADGTVHLMTEEGECILPRSAIAKLKTLYTEAQAASDADREPDETNTERTEHT